MREHLRPKTLPNRMSPWVTDDEEREDRRAAVEAHLAVLRTQLPDLLSRFARIPDPRRPGSVRHQITVLLLYGVLLFAFAMESRRQANRELSRPGLWEALRVAFPELDSVPHADTLERLLEKTEPGDIEAVLMARLRALLRRQKLRALMVERGYVVAVDGEKLWQRTQAFAPEAPHRGESDEARYAVYVVKAALCCPEGVTLPLAAEFCENVQVGKDGKVDEEQKQDCEYRACQRLCTRLKAAFPRLPILFVARRQPVRVHADRRNVPAKPLGLHGGAQGGEDARAMAGGKRAAHPGRQEEHAQAHVAKAGADVLVGERHRTRGVEQRSAAAVRLPCGGVRGALVGAAGRRHRRGEDGPPRVGEREAAGRQECP